MFVDLLAAVGVAEIDAVLDDPFDHWRRPAALTLTRRQHVQAAGDLGAAGQRAAHQEGLADTRCILVGDKAPLGGLLIAGGDVT